VTVTQLGGTALIIAATPARMQIRPIPAQGGAVLGSYPVPQLRRIGVCRCRSDADAVAPRSGSDYRTLPFGEARCRGVEAARNHQSYSRCLMLQVGPRRWQSCSGCRRVRWRAGGRSQLNTRSRSKQSSGWRGNERVPTGLLPGVAAEAVAVRGPSAAARPARDSRARSDAVPMRRARICRRS
jgi:hypothetical protein